MLFKRVHTLKFKTVAVTGGGTDANGDPIPGTPVETTHEVSCRAEPNGGGKMVKSNNGQDVVYSYKIFLDAIPDGIGYGTFLELFGNGQKFGEGTAILPFGYQKHAAIWV